MTYKPFNAVTDYVSYYYLIWYKPGSLNSKPVDCQRLNHHSQKARHIFKTRAPKLSSIFEFAEKALKAFHEPEGSFTSLSPLLLCVIIQDNNKNEVTVPSLNTFTAYHVQYAAWMYNVFLRVGKKPQRDALLTLSVLAVLEEHAELTEGWIERGQKEKWRCMTKSKIEE